MPGKARLWWFQLAPQVRSSLCIQSYHVLRCVLCFHLNCARVRVDSWPCRHLKAATCWGNQGSFGSQPTLTLYALGPTKQIIPTPPPPEHELTPTLVDADPLAVCLDGKQPSVSVWTNNITASTSWVLSIGGASPGLQYCFPASGCYMFSPCVICY